MRIDCSKTENYFKEKSRMTDNCNPYLCKGCPLEYSNNFEEMYCREFEQTHPDKAIEIVQKWSDEHPPETMAEHFFKLFPNAPRNENGVPYVCQCLLDLIPVEPCLLDCEECWNKPYKGEDEQ